MADFFCLLHQSQPRIKTRLGDLKVAPLLLREYARGVCLQGRKIEYLFMSLSDVFGLVDAKQVRGKAITIVISPLTTKRPDARSDL